MAGSRRWSVGFGWLTGLSVLAALAINIAGIGGIALARRGVLDEAARDLRLETAARARGMESNLASIRADLAFLTGSPVFFGLESALASTDPREARWRRLEAEGALLLFLRGHPEMTHLLAGSKSGVPLIEAARRGGVPVLWRSSAGTSAGPVVGAAAPRGVDSPEIPVTGSFAFTSGSRSVAGAVTLEVTLDAAKLLGSSLSLEESARACSLRDRTGRILAREGGSRESASDRALPFPTSSGSRDWISAHAPVAGESWSAPSPWTLSCARRREAVMALVEPVAGRYRMTLALNLAAMLLALLLGAFAVQEARRRQHLEATAREEVRVREVERQLFHAERLGTVGRLAAGIAHEINNPLEGVSNYLSLAREDLSRGDVESARRRLDGVQEGVQRAGAIVRQVLAHAEPASTPDTPLDLGDVLRQSLEFVKSRPDFRGIDFGLDLSEPSLRVRGNPVMLGQVFLNLLLNACEAQPRGGEVRVGARREGDRVLVEIADRGPGVPPSEAARIFEPFFSTKHSTGLGLSICYAIARQHGADLRFEDRVDGGAVFKILFPDAEVRRA